jgi:hypothetical protein
MLRMMRSGRAVLALAALALAACQPRTQIEADAGRCVVVRLDEDARRASMTDGPVDEAPRPNLLPTPVLTAQEESAAGDCIRPTLHAVARTSSNERLRESVDWRPFATHAFRSEHGFYLEIFGNAPAAGYMRFEDGSPLPVGAAVKKHAFRVLRTGDVVAGPQFLMERMPAGYDPRVGDWKFTLIDPTGRTVGESRSLDGERVEFCVACHRGAWRQDFLIFPPPTHRPRG